MLLCNYVVHLKTQRREPLWKVTVFTFTTGLAADLLSRFCRHLFPGRLTKLSYRPCPHEGEEVADSKIFLQLAPLGGRNRARSAFFEEFVNTIQVALGQCQFAYCLSNLTPDFFVDRADCMRKDFALRYSRISIVHISILQNRLWSASVRDFGRGESVSKRHLDFGRPARKAWRACCHERMATQRSSNEMSKPGSRRLLGDGS